MSTVIDRIADQQAHQRSEALRRLRDLTIEIIQDGLIVDETVILDLLGTAGLTVSEYRLRYQQAQQMHAAARANERGQVARQEALAAEQELVRLREAEGAEVRAVHDRYEPQRSALQTKIDSALAEHSTSAGTWTKLRGLAVKQHAWLAAAIAEAQHECQELRRRVASCEGMTSPEGLRCLALARESFERAAQRLGNLNELAANPWPLPSDLHDPEVG